LGRTNDAVETVLLEYADLLAIVAEDRFKPRAYEKAARAVGGYHADLDGMDLAEIRQIPSVGSSIADKIHEFLTSGTIAALDSLRSQIPASVREMTEIPGLGPKRALAIYKEQGIDSIEELRAALEGGRLDDVKGFGPKTRENILRGIDRMSQASGRALLSVAGDLAGYFVDRLSERTDVQRIEIAGSLRRMRETIGDVDLLVASEEPTDVMEVFATAGMVDRVLARGDTKSSVLTRTGIQIDLRVVPLESWGAAMIYFTGSKAHNIRIREMAVRKGLKLNE